MTDTIAEPAPAELLSGGSSAKRRGPAAATTNEDDTRFYPYPPTSELLDSVTTIISGTNSKPWIKTWYGDTASTWAVDNLTVLARTMKTEGRDAAIALAAGEAKRKRDIKSEAGVHVHDVQEALILWAASRDGSGGAIAIPSLPEHLEGVLYDLGDGAYEPIEDVVNWMIDGFIQFVSDFSPRFLATEMTVFNQPLGYAGTLDMIIELTGYGVSIGTGPKGGDEIIPCPGSVLVICVDTKTGKAPEGTWKEQLAAYRRATECLLPLGEIRPMLATDCGMVLHLRPDYPGGYMLTLVSAGDDEAAWLRFAKAASVYRDRQLVKDKPGPSVRALRPDGTMPGPRLADLAGEGYGRSLAPLRKALGSDTELADLARFTEAELLAVKGIGPKLIDTTRGMLADYRLSLKGEALPVTEMTGQVAA